MEGFNNIRELSLEEAGVVAGGYSGSYVEGCPERDDRIRNWGDVLELAATAIKEYVEHLEHIDNMNGMYSPDGAVRLESPPGTLVMQSSDNWIWVDKNNDNQFDYRIKQQADGSYLIDKGHGPEILPGS